MNNFNLGVALNIGTAVFAGISALASIGAVYEAKQQVNAALEAVTKSESVKYISDYSGSAYRLCRAITPEILRKEIYRNVSVDKTDVGRMKWGPIQQMDTVRQRVDGKIPVRNEELMAAEEDLFVKTQAVSTWLPPGDLRNNLGLSTATLHLRLPSGSYSQDNSVESLIGRRNYCETAVETIVSEMLKSDK